MKKTQQVSAKKIELLKTKILALTAKAQKTVAGGDGNAIALVGLKPASYGCTL